MSRSSTQLVRLAVHNMLVDRLTAEVGALFDDAGIDCVLVKGPVIAEWLYRTELRGYGDSDLLVSPADWYRALALLDGHGFRLALEVVGHPRLHSEASTSLVRGAENVDLHRTLPGLDAAPELVWQSIRADAHVQEVGGRQTAVPARPAVLMHLALHAAHHHSAEKPLEDLRRGIAQGGWEAWTQAAELARKLDGLAAFAAGLSRIPQGVTLAQRLEVQDFGSLHFDLRIAGIPTAEGLHELLGRDMSIFARCVIVAREMFPSRRFMRWWSSLARRGRCGLVASYPVRWAWLAVMVPRGMTALWWARRRRRGRQTTGER